MKHIAFFIPLLFCIQLVHAQAIAVDSSFAHNGYIHTSVFANPYGYSTYLDLTPDNQLLVLGDGPSNQTGLLFCKYSVSGDSIQGYHFPINFNNYGLSTAIKTLDDGSFIIANEQSGNGLKHVTPEGAVDSTFGTDGGAPLFHNAVQDIIISRNNRILLAGQNLNNINGDLAGAYVLAYDMTGHLDSTFGVNGRFRYLNQWIDFFNKIIEQPDGKLLLTGCSLLQSDPGYNTVMRLTPDGFRDSTFGVNGLISDQIYSGGENYGMVLQTDQKIVVCGYDDGLNGAIVIRYTADGTRDATFGMNGVVELPMLSEATDLLQLPNGKLLVYGKLWDSGGHIAFIQLKTDGSIDPYFGTGGVYFNPLPQLKLPMKMMLLEGNKLVATSSVTHPIAGGGGQTYIQLQGFLLNLNVGAITPQDKPSLWVYPNPVQGALEVKFTLDIPQQLHINLYDLQGKLIQHVLPVTSFDSGEHTLPLQLSGDIPSGNYLLTLSSGDKPAVTIQITKD